MTAAPTPSDEQPESTHRYRVSLARWSAVGFGVFLLLSTAALTLTRDRAHSPVTRQVIEFNHRLHVETLDIECSTCHEFYSENTFSGLPTAETCGLCHEEPSTDSAEEAKLLTLLSDGAELEWNPLFRQPAHVFFSHRRHAIVAELGCDECHGDIASTESPPERVRLLMMDDCIDCHRQSGAKEDCTTCHR